MNQHHSSQAGQQDPTIDVTDPWRGLYSAERLSAPSEYGETFHPDIPCWPDDREDALDKLVHAQGFDFQIVAGDFTEEAVEDGDELYWQEMRAWNPEAPEGEWRLAWKGDTEDGPYAWFVRPMALRPELDAAPPAQAVEMSPEFTDTARAAIAWVLWHHLGGSSPVGQPLRFALGMGQHDRMTDHQIAEAKRFAAWAGATTEGFHRHKTAQAMDLGQLTRWTIPSTECTCCDGGSEPLQDANGDWVTFADIRALINKEVGNG